ncbi:MAG: 7-carboxy-7-deazaguanine synthase QueE [Candidatus Gastranaerophilales bacterium]|nr:7-carboxy-7-deazaguanine synthase QueE [Candidatus Gastranaerophilales bacterium]
MKAKINEIFSSIQGEGPVVGYKQLFIRFCGCNLKCDYCDTEFMQGKEYSTQELFDTITKEYDLKTFHSISLTGGEPLLHAEFLKEFLPLIKGQTKIYLETNATLSQNLKIVKNYIDIISADIKLAVNPDIHKEFFLECKGTETFAKIVFDEKITDEQIKTCCIIGSESDIELILQPKMDTNNKMCVSSEFCNQILDKFTSNYNNVRLIPQVHKFLDVR